jgi:uncharacterized protein (DUF169 family)
MKWKETYQALSQMLRLRTTPIALKLLTEEKMPEGAEKPEGPRNICQITALVRYYGKVLYFTAEDMCCIVGSVALGLDPVSSAMESGEIALKMYEDRGKAQRFVDAAYMIPYGKFKAAVAAPINQDQVTFDPDQLLIYGNTAQIDRLIQGWKWAKGERLDLDLGGEYGICSDAIAQCYVNNRTVVAIPCWGDRLHAMALDDELIFAIPGGEVDAVMEGLHKTEHPGFSNYPVQYTGINHTPIWDYEDCYLPDRMLRFKKEKPNCNIY